MGVTAICAAGELPGAGDHLRLGLERLDDGSLIRRVDLRIERETHEIGRPRRRPVAIELGEIGVRAGGHQRAGASGASVRFASATSAVGVAADR